MVGHFDKNQKYVDKTTITVYPNSCRAGGFFNRVSIHYLHVSYKLVLLLTHYPLTTCIAPCKAFIIIKSFLSRLTAVYRSAKRI